MELLNAISSRRSIRSYKDISVENCKLEKILKAGCAAPVGKNLYEYYGRSEQRNSSFNFPRVKNEYAGGF